jgi:hypothetical protein
VGEVLHVLQNIPHCLHFPQLLCAISKEIRGGIGSGVSNWLLLYRLLSGGYGLKAIAMDLPHTPSTVSQLQCEVAAIVSELQDFVEHLGSFEMTSHIENKRSGSKIEIALWSPVGEYCVCTEQTCKELQHGKFPFRDILLRVQSDVTLEYFRQAVENEKVFLKKFQSF